MIALIATQKTSPFFDVSLLKKLRNLPRWSFLEKWSFLGVFLDFFSALVHRTELSFFSLQSVRPGALFKLSNTPIR
jgi:hypothetical protein